MKTMTSLPMATAPALTARALPNADVRAPWTIGMPSRHVAIVTAVAPCPSRHFGTKAYGTRRLGEPAST